MLGGDAMQEQLAELREEIKRRNEMMRKDRVSWQIEVVSQGTSAEPLAVVPRRIICMR